MAEINEIMQNYKHAVNFELVWARSNVIYQCLLFVHIDSDSEESNSAKSFSSSSESSKIRFITSSSVKYLLAIVQNAENDLETGSHVGAVMFFTNGALRWVFFSQ